MELVLALHEETHMRVTCNNDYSHTADLHPLLFQNDKEAGSMLDDPIAYGKKIYNVLFPPNTPAQQALAIRPERLLLVALEPLLDAIPWEYAYGLYGALDPTTSDTVENFLVLECPFVRGLPAEQCIVPPTLDQDLHIVAIPSDPLSEPIEPLAIEDEWMRLKEIAQALPYALTLERTAPPTLERVRSLVANQKGRVVHFMGHGGQDAQQGAMLCFEQDNGGLHLVSAKELMQRVRGTVFLVTLNACVSATPGPTLFHNLAAALVRQKTPYALGMRLSIVDEDARTFARAFYNELARGTPVEEALFQARLTLKLQSPRSWVVGVPVLYTSLSEPAPGFRCYDGTPTVKDKDFSIDVSVLPPIEGVFRGRINDMLTLGTQLTGDQRPRILTILGSGGQGKTALALKLVERFAFACSGGVWANALENLPSRSTVVIALAQFLGIGTQEILDLPIIERLIVARLNQRRTLLILDNAETLVEAVEAQNIDALDLVAFLKKLLGTQACLLVTSRVPLGWDDEQTHMLDGLSPKEGALLFWQGAPQHRNEIDLPLAATLSHRLEGHPLGLRLLAGAFNDSGLSLSAFLQTAEQRLIEAENKYVGPEHRHRKLYACIETSVRSLAPPLRSLLSGLWIFHAPFLADTAVAIFDPDTDETEQHSSPIRDHLHKLWQRSLLMRKTMTARDGNVQLYTLLPTTRPYVEHHLAQTYEPEVLRERFITAYLQIMERIYAEVHRSTIFVRQVREDLEWISEALEQEEIATIDVSRYLFWWGSVVYRLGDSLHGLRLLERGLEAIQGIDTDLTLQISNNMAVMYRMTGRPQEALKLYEQSLPIMRKVGNSAGEAMTLNNMAVVYHDMGYPQEALKLYEQSLPIMRKVRDRPMEAATLNNMAEVYRETGHSQEALKLYEQALPISYEVGNRSLEGAIINNMAQVYNIIRRSEEAMKFYEQALLITQEIGDRAGEAMTLNNMALVYSSMGRPQQALKIYEDTLPITREVGNRVGEAVTLHGLASLYLSFQRYSEALVAFEQSIALSQQITFPAVTIAGLIGLAFLLYQHLNRPVDAILSLEHALHIFAATGLSHDAAGQTPEQVQQWLATMRGEPVSNDLPPATIQAIQEFLNAEDLDAVRRVIEAHHAILFQPAVEIIFEQNIEQAKTENNERVVHLLELHLALLRECQENGIAQAFEDLLSRMQSAEEPPSFDAELIPKSIHALLGEPQEKMAHVQYLATLSTETTNEQLKALLNTIQIALFGGDRSQLGQHLEGVYRQAWEAILAGLSPEGGETI